MKSKIKAVVIIAIIVVISYFYANIDKNNIIYDKGYDDSDYLQTGSIYTESLKQSFVCKEKMLDGVSAKIIVVGEPTDVDVQYTITEVATGDKYTSTVSASEMKNNKYYYFKTDKPFADSLNKEYEFEIVETGATEMSGIGFYLTPGTQKDTSLSVKGNSTDGTTIMSGVTHRFDLETMVMFLICIAFIYGFIRVLYKLFNK